MRRERAFWVPWDERRERYNGWRGAGAMRCAVVFPRMALSFYSIRWRFRRRQRMTTWTTFLQWGGKSNGAIGFAVTFVVLVDPLYIPRVRLRCLGQSWDFFWDGFDGLWTLYWLWIGG